MLAGGLDVRLTGTAADASAAPTTSTPGSARRAPRRARHGITVLDTDVTADGAVLFLAAGAPVATGEEEERMLRALRDILAIPEAARLRLRAGTNRGPVFAGDFGTPHRRTYTAMGDTTNLAARIAHRASPGELLATADVLARSTTEFAADALPAFTAKGKREPVVPYRVGAPVGTAAKVVARLPLTGRDAELRLLLDAHAVTARHRGGLVDITGEPGAGKSRLIAELLAQPEVSGLLIVRCSTSDTASPYGAFRWPLRELAGIAPDAAPDEAGVRLATWIRDVLPDADAVAAAARDPVRGRPRRTRPRSTALAPAFRRARLHAALGDVLAAVAPAGRVLLVEDVHWADEATLALLVALRHRRTFAADRLLVAPGGRVRRRRAGRPSPVSTSSRWPRKPSPAWPCSRVDRPLSDADLAGIVARAAGNPLFTRELATVTVATGSVDRLPERLESLRREPDRPPRPARPAPAPPGRGAGQSRWTSTCSPRPSPATRTSATSGSGTASESSSPGRARRGSGSATTSSATPPTRASPTPAAQELHRDLALAMERRAGDDTDAVAAQLATHFAEGGLHEAGVPLRAAAGDLARAQYANADAAAL